MKNKMGKKYLLREYYALCENGYCEDLLLESEKADITENKALYLTGVLQHGGEKNGNGRVYPPKVLMREMTNYQKLIDEKRALGEMDHPESSVVELKNVSHMVTRYWNEGNVVKGVIKVLPTPMGNILRSLVESGVQCGISSRGLGSVNETQGGEIIVQEDFQLICFDVVADPSTKGAFMSQLREHQETQPIFNKNDRVNRLMNSILETK